MSFLLTMLDTKRMKSVLFSYKTKQKIQSSDLGSYKEKAPESARPLSYSLLLNDSQVHCVEPAGRWVGGGRASALHHRLSPSV